VYGIVRFTVADTSVSAYDRAIFTLPGNKALKDERVKLHDVRVAPDLLHGSAGIDNQGFTYIKHNLASSIYVISFLFSIL
jgi:GA4 desaturase